MSSLLSNLRKRGEHAETEEPVPAPAVVSSDPASPEAEDTKDAIGVQASGIDALNIVKNFEKEHYLDPNLPLDELNAMEQAVASGDAEKGLELEQTLLEEDSPYPEVRAAVRNYDSGGPASTIRAWTIGLLLCTIGSGINMLFSLRWPSVFLSTYVIQLVSYPMALGWDMVMPDKEFSLFGLKFNFKPGPFNMKEHVIIVVMSNAAYGNGVLYATDVLVTQKIMYNQNFGWGFDLLFGITTLCTGYGLAGLCRRWLVWPAAAIWPSDLVNTALFYTLHDHSVSDPAKTNGWSIGRYRWFLYVLTASWIWYWFPGWIIQGLSFFVFATWIAPNNAVVNQIFGGTTGLGLIPITFDWNVISGQLGVSPLIPPAHALANTLFGVIVFFVIVPLGVHYSNVWYGKYLPMQNTHSYDNTGNFYNVSRVLTADLEFDEEAYLAYSPLFLSTNFALCYGMSFATLSSLVIYTSLYHGKQIWHQFKAARNQEDDIHMKLMKKYDDAPDWWYLTLFIIMVGISFAVCCAWATNFPWWAYIICMIIPIVFMVPIGMIQSFTNIQIGLNVLTEFIVGYMIPGRPLAMMMFKNYGYICMAQALGFAQDLKLGHYMKVPPKALFWSQLVASIWSAIVQIAVMDWALYTLPDVCTDQQVNNFICPGVNTFYTASVVWGAIGPRRIFSAGAIYSALNWYWLVGAVFTVAVYFATKRWPKSWFRYVMVPVIFAGSGNIPPATVYIYLCWCITGLIFNHGIRKRWPGWWGQYNYITSAGLDCGLILCLIIIFFCLQLPKVNAPNWYMNVGVFNTMDATDTAVQVVLTNGTFGPSTWK